MTIYKAQTSEKQLVQGDRKGLRHQRWTLASAACVIILGLGLPELSIAQQFWLTLLPIAVVGLSHGGADPMIIKSLMGHRRNGVAMATALYLASAASFVALIWWQPVIALLTFLLLSAWHFGYTDAGFTHSRTTSGSIWLSGSLTIIGPMVGHPLQSGELFAWLIGQEPVRTGELVRLIGPLLGASWICGFALIAYRYRDQMKPGALAELVLLAGVMCTLPPLLAFAFYFCIVHSLRHFLVIVELGDSRSAHQSIPAFLLRRVAPATAAAIALAFITWMLIVALEPEASLLTEAVRVMFWALAALTVPHAVAVALWWRHDTAAR